VLVTEDKLNTLRDLTQFAPKFLTIKTKSGALELFGFNQAQQYIHRRLQAQLKATGKVRAVVLKGRQQGCSTYIQARYFHKIITSRGKKAFILTHEAEATKNLFEMTKRYYEKLPEGLCPEADRSSAKELRFIQFDSGYSIGTAGNKGVGRSQTIQLFHGSEVAYWPSAEDHAKGVMQAISNESGTEIILESTANGIGNYFYNMWQSTKTGDSDYQSIFIPWYWQNEYKSYKEGLFLTDEEERLLKIYEKDGLTKEHLGWRRIKILELSSDEEAGRELFFSEYPMSATEAFRNPIANVFINAKHVLRARGNDVQSESRLIIGVDPAIGDKDKTAIIRRRGRVAYSLETFRNHNTMEIAGRLSNIIRQEQPHKVYIDCIGIGAGIVDRLQEMGLTMVEGVNVARTANNKERFANLRAELWWEMRDWLMQNELPVQIPDDDTLHGALVSLGYKYRSNGQLLIESKDELRARGMPSPDEGDALSLTFFSGIYGAELDVPITIIPQHQRGMFM
jgi:hypothetical protein